MQGLNKMKQAFILLEVMLYATINALLIITVFTVIACIQRTMLEQKYLRIQLNNNNTVIHLLQRDLMSAHYQPQSWAQEAIIFKRNIFDQQANPYQSSIGWQPKKNGLNRIEGTYSVTTKQWLSKKKTDFFPCSITSMTHTKHYNQSHNSITAVTISYQTITMPKAPPITKFFLVSLRNGYRENTPHVV